MKKISPQTIAHAADLLACNYSARETAQYVGVNERTIRRWSKRPEVAAKIEQEAEQARSLARQQTSFIAATSVDRAVTCLALLEMCATRSDFALSPARLRCVQAILRESHYWASFLERTEKQRAVQTASNPQAAAAPADDISMQGSADEKAAEKRTVPDITNRTAHPESKPEPRPDMSQSASASQTSQAPQPTPSCDAPTMSTAKNRSKKRTMPDIKNAESASEESVSESTKNVAQTPVSAVPSPEHLQKLLNEIYSVSDNSAGPPNRPTGVKTLGKSA
jgi:hypothetical protein